MAPWTGVVLALAEPGSDELGSRLSTYLHPLAGRPLAWHVVQAVASLGAARVVVAGGPELGPELFADVPAEVRLLDASPDDLRWALSAAAEGGARVLAVDAAAPTAGDELRRLLDSDGDALLTGDDGAVLAAWMGADAAAALAEHGGDLGALRSALPDAAELRDEDGFTVRSRAALARASACIRDRVVHRLMEGGVTFLLPESTLVDVDVLIGRDTVVYPGVVLEGQTVVGEETVIGPACRIISSRIGSGVELKGFNYLSHTSIRNHAVLEPYVRRGFDE
jgi:bifunctional N-acetylglucosamine-1-phosphate-uridyltransferase/glucosamine-1-phosphate-acetyltransferase GlmU-like protein